MQDYWLDMALSIVFSVVRATVKNKEMKEQLRASLVKLRDKLIMLYPLDEN